MVELGLYALLLAAAALAVWRRPVVSLYLFVVGLALHNAVMAALYASGVRGTTLTAISAWKEILLAVALLRVGLDAWRARRLPFRFGLADWLAVAFGALVIVYALDSAVGARRSRRRTRPSPSRCATTSFRWGRTSSGARSFCAATICAGSAGRCSASPRFVAGIGLVDVYAVSIGWWRTNGVIDYFHRHLGYDYHGTGVRTEPDGSVYGLPENFIYNVGGDKPFLRRLVSTFLSPLASGYLFVVALLLAFRRARAAARALGCSRPPAFCGRSRARRSSRSRPGSSCWRRSSGAPGRLVAAVAVIGVAIGWAHLFPKIGPTGRFTPVDITYQQAIGKNGPKSFSRGERERAVAPLALARAEGRRAHDDPSPAGLRARQRRADRLAHRHAAEGR